MCMYACASSREGSLDVCELPPSLPPKKRKRRHHGSQAIWRVALLGSVCLWWEIALTVNFRKNRVIGACPPTIKIGVGSKNNITICDVAVAVVMSSLFFKSHDPKNIGEGKQWQRPEAIINDTKRGDRLLIIPVIVSIIFGISCWPLVLPRQLLVCPSSLSHPHHASLILQPDLESSILITLPKGTPQAQLSVTGLLWSRRWLALLRGLWSLQSEHKKYSKAKAKMKEEASLHHSRRNLTTIPHQAKKGSKWDKRPHVCVSTTNNQSIVSNSKFWLTPLLSPVDPRWSCSIYCVDPTRKGARQVYLLTELDVPLLSHCSSGRSHMYHHRSSCLTSHHDGAKNYAVHSRRSVLAATELSVPRGTKNGAKWTAFPSTNCDKRTPTNYLFSTHMF